MVQGRVECPHIVQWGRCSKFAASRRFLHLAISNRRVVRTSAPDDCRLLAIAALTNGHRGFL